MANVTSDDTIIYVERAPPRPKIEVETEGITRLGPEVTMANMKKAPAHTFAI
jgi:hypothetical protein